MRRTFISLAQIDGALPHLLQRVTHAPKADIISLYSTYTGASLCGEVSKLRVTLPALAPVLHLSAA